MKTSVIMRRFVGHSAVRQDSKTGMFNANDLLSIYNSQSKKMKRLDSYTRRKESKDLTEAIIKRLNRDNTNSCYLESDVFTTSRGVVKSERGGTWMHPYMFIDFAMWLSPDFKVMCIEWIHDHLTDLRNQVGDEFRELTSAIKRHIEPVTVDVYRDEVKMINKLVFGSEDSNQRQTASKEQLKLMQILQNADIKLIQEGKTYTQRLESLHRVKQLVTV